MGCSRQAWVDRLSTIDMDLALTRLCRDDVAQELDEGRARMTRHRLADDLESRAIAP
jgi:hypothetical protein